MHGVELGTVYGMELWEQCMGWSYGDNVWGGARGSVWDGARAVYGMELGQCMGWSYRESVRDGARDNIRDLTRDSGREGSIWTG